MVPGSAYRKKRKFSPTQVEKQIIVIEFTPESSTLHDDIFQG
jgi:hypothetical protein